jgi:heme-degrading monooxygenase HmoA
MVAVLRHLSSPEVCMFAHVVTGQAEAEGFDRITGVAREQLPVVRRQPGFRGFSLLTARQSDHDPTEKHHD